MLNIIRGLNYFKEHFEGISLGRWREFYCGAHLCPSTEITYMYTKGRGRGGGGEGGSGGVGKLQCRMAFSNHNYHTLIIIIVSAKSLLTGRSLNPALKNRTSICAYGNGLPQQRFTTVR